MPTHHDYYFILEIDPDATTHQILRAYRRLAFKYHPDKNIHNMHDAEVRFKLVHEAYDILSDATKRAKYDATYVRRHRFAGSDISTYDVETDDMGMTIHDMHIHDLSHIDDAFSLNVAEIVK